MDTLSTRGKIKKVLIDIMMTTDVDKITTVVLAKKAGISRATFYRYYDSVENVLIETENEFTEGMRDVSRYYISAPFDVKNLNIPYPEFIAIAEYIRAHKDFFLAITGPHGDGRFVKRWHKFLKEFYYGKLAYKELIQENTDVYVEAILAGSDSLVRYWLTKRSDLSAEEIVPITQKILYGPFVCC